LGGRHAPARLGIAKGGLAAAFGGQDGRLLLALGPLDARFAYALCLEDRRALFPLGLHLPPHRHHDILGRRDVLDLDAQHLHAPRAGRLVDVGELVLLVGDDVGGVVGDDVEEDLDAARVRIGDQRFELGVRAEVRVDLGEVGDPVAVISRTGVGSLALYGTVLEARRQPDRARAEALDVVELRAQSGDVATLEEALVGRVEARREPVAGESAGVVPYFLLVYKQHAPLGQ